MATSPLRSPVLVSGIDQGTSGTKFCVFDSVTGDIVASHNMETKRIEPKEGWTEMDPLHIMDTVWKSIDATVQQLKDKNIDIREIKCLGITNQMLTLIPWSSKTGKPFYNAIVWCDIRTQDENEKELDKVPGRNKDHFRRITGLPLSPLFWYTKIPWILKNVPGVMEAIKDGTCMLGTVNSWILWNLTGGVDGGLYLTDISNGQITGLFNLETCNWDPEICRYFGIPHDVFAEVRSTSEIYGYIKSGPLAGIPISGMLGDQKAGTVGQLCFTAGQSKCTYGTAGGLNINTGTKAVYSTCGMMTLPLFQLGKSAPVIYNLLGAIEGCGQLMRWLRDNLQIVKSVAEIETLATSVESSHDCFFVPAFGGLLAPYWEDDARGTIVGMTGYTRREHICRAALESACFMVTDLLEVVEKDTGYPISELRVDGGMTVDNLMMQIQANFINKTVVRPSVVESTSFGAALMAGAADGINVFPVSPDKLKLNVAFPLPETIFKPAMDDHERERLFKRWEKAIERARHWTSQ
ncbi:glycerol kinase-like isoform X1 [Ostrea edulis]|uniref:glycerol kinase-like isoform X1 n=1 Tax=Ostrea edulis TaxID=37623 RepID=UPI0024AF7865|nr:glycerol kinase-like isoform X1 [Ostrea edulis]